jgi:fructose-1,6-bisphosphatase/inositol monophosphatase family enzyme
MVDGMTLHVGHETGHIDDGHRCLLVARARLDTTLDLVEPNQVLELLHDVADQVGRALSGVVDWGLSGRRDGQYSADLVADEEALKILRRAGVGILSEESGAENIDREIVVIVDPLDGSTNASRGVPHFATALSAVDRHGWVASLVAHQARPVKWWATRAGGAFRNGERLDRPLERDWKESVVAVSGRPSHDLGCWQTRAMGASAIDICSVADGTFDAFIDLVPSAHGVWDYAAAAHICSAVGLEVVDAAGRDLVVLDHLARRTPVVAVGANQQRALDERRRMVL